MACYTYLDGPRGTTGLTRGGGRTRGWGLKVGGKWEAVLVGSYHGDGAANGGTYGNRPELTLSGPAIRAVTILAQGNEATA